MTCIYDAAIDFDREPTALEAIGGEIETFLTVRSNVLAHNYTLLRQPVDTSRPRSPFWASRVEFAWAAEASYLPCLVAMLENLTLKNCTRLGGVLFVHAGCLLSSLPSALSVSRQAGLYRLAPTVSLQREGSGTGLTAPAIWDLQHLSLHTWAEARHCSMQRQPAVIFSEAPLIQAIM